MAIHYLTVAGSKWQWGEDYVRATATYVVACPANRKCEVGMGIFAFSRPQGEKVFFSGEKEITVVGIGSLHFRVDDGGGPCRVGFALKDSKPISWTWTY